MSSMYNLLSYKYYVLPLRIISIKYYECVSVFLPSLPGMQITSFLRVISVDSLALHIFSYLVTGKILGEKILM